MVVFVDLKMCLFICLVIYLLDFQSHHHHQGHMATSNFYWKEKTRTYIEMFTCMIRTTAASQVSWKSYPRVRNCPDQVTNLR